MSELKIVLADDHVILLEGIKLYMEMQTGYKVVGIAQSGEELLSLLEKDQANVVVIDINMSGSNGLKTLRQIKELYPDIKVIVLSMYQSEVFVQEAKDANADGYVFKSRAGKELVAAVKAVLEDDTFFSEPEPSENEDLKPQATSAENEWEIIQTLTPREKEILMLLPDDLSTKEIADKLFSSPHTIETHRRNLLRKVGAKSVNGLVNFAIRNSIFLKE